MRIKQYLQPVMKTLAKLNDFKQLMERVSKNNEGNAGVGKVIRIVIGIDATVSMGHALAQVLMNIRVCLARL